MDTTSSTENLTDDVFMSEDEEEERFEINQVEHDIIGLKDQLARKMAKSRQLIRNHHLHNRDKINDINKLVKCNAKTIARNQKAVNGLLQNFQSPLQEKTVDVGTQTWTDTIQTVSEKMNLHRKASTVQELWSISSQLKKSIGVCDYEDDATDIALKGLNIATCPNHDIQNHADLIGASVAVANHNKLMSMNDRLNTIELELSSLNQKLDQLFK